jgi:hypothetical protein
MSSKLLYYRFYNYFEVLESPFQSKVLVTWLSFA